MARGFGLTVKTERYPDYFTVMLAERPKRECEKWARELEKLGDTIELKIQRENDKKVVHWYVRGVDPGYEPDTGDLCPDDEHRDYFGWKVGWQA